MNVWMGKSSINGPCSMPMLNYQRVFHGKIRVFSWFLSKRTSVTPIILSFFLPAKRSKNMNQAKSGGNCEDRSFPVVSENQVKPGPTVIFSIWKSGCGNLWPQKFLWLVVWTPLKNINQLGWLFPIYGNGSKLWYQWPTEMIMFSRKTIHLGGW